MDSQPQPEKEGSGPREDKLTLACFNSGDVPELIGRLSVVLSHATHKVISLPMFRKDLGVRVGTLLCQVVASRAWK